MEGRRREGTEGEQGEKLSGCKTNLKRSVLLTESVKIVSYASQALQYY